jgi:hypothetical protein
LELEDNGLSMGIKNSQSKEQWGSAETQMYLRECSAL